MPKVSDVFRLIKHFDKKDFAEFYKFLKSPYLNELKALSFIFKEISSNKKLIITSKFYELEKILLEKSGYTEFTVRHLLSRLKNSIIEYFGVKSILKDDIYIRLKQNESLLNIYEIKILSKGQENLLSRLNFSKDIEEEYFYYSFLLNNNLFDTSFTKKNYSDKLKEKPFDLVKNSSVDLYIYALTQIVYNYVNFTLRNIDVEQGKLIWQDIDIDGLFKTGQDILKNKSNKYRNITYNLFYKLYQTFKNIKKDEFYEDYKSYFLLNARCFNNDVFRTHFTILTSYCTIRERILNKKNKFVYEWINLTDEIIKREYLKSSSKKYMYPALFRNYIAKCFAINNPGILKNFINKNSKILPPAEKNQMINFGLTHYYYLKRDYRQSLKYLNDIKMDYFVYRYDLLNLELKIYYEKYNPELIERAIHNYRTQVKKETFLTKYDKARMLNMLKYYQRLILLNEKLKQGKSYMGDVYLLRDNIISEETFTMKNWMLKNLKEMIIKNNKEPKKIIIKGIKNNS
jgi:hypothetical protein